MSANLKLRTGTEPYAPHQAPTNATARDVTAGTAKGLLFLLHASSTHSMQQAGADPRLKPETAALKEQFSALGAAQQWGFREVVDLFMKYSPA